MSNILNKTFHSNQDLNPHRKFQKKWLLKTPPKLNWREFLLALGEKKTGRGAENRAKRAKRGAPRKN